MPKLTLRVAASSLAALLAAGVFAPAARAQSSWTYADLTDMQAEELRDATAAMKTAPRGPYLRIRWYCEDGSVLPPQPYACREHGGGRQHAQYTDDTIRFGEWGFHFGTILAATSYEEFFDADNANYRLRELVLQNYLESVDDGWIMRRARYYRGARQIETEEVVGREYLERALSNVDWQIGNPLLTTMLVGTIPHGQGGGLTDQIRALALRAANLDSGFMDLRIKIHSTPSGDDLQAVRAYRQGVDPGAGEELEIIDALIAALEQRYEAGLDPAFWQALGDRLGSLPVAAAVAALPQRLEGVDDLTAIRTIAPLLHDARDLLNDPAALGSGVTAGKRSLALLDAIVAMEGPTFAAAGSWTRSDAVATMSRHDLLEVVGVLFDAVYGTGWLTPREHRSLCRAIERLLALDPSDVTRARYYTIINYLTNAADWAPATLHQVYGAVHERYAPVEPLVQRFGDNALRGSILLAFSGLMERLAADAASEAGVRHVVFDRLLGSGVKALNSGVAVGTLHVIDDPAAIANLDPDAIYVLPETPAELGPVAGILTLDAGSRLSHMQLLARGLGIPNAAIQSANVDELRAHEGEQVLYAVSPLGAVLLTPAADVPAADLVPFLARDTGDVGTVTIDVETLDLSQRSVMVLADIDAEDSGRIVGPKAANLGQLFHYFPERVAPALILPFGIYRAHIDRDLDNDGTTLYEEIVEIFEEERRARAAGADELAIRNEVSRRLEAIREAIMGMELLPEFRRELIVALQEHFGDPGTYGVFVRSDTNVEDLPNFSGAGLNLTEMNRIGTESILRAIRNVWASPFTTRSYMWRQRLISNPEAVYPSIVLLRSVASEASGVLVTTDITQTTAVLEDIDAADAWTATVARGVGGVVGGEAAETILLPASADATWEPVLLASARAPWQNVLRDTGSGGLDRVPTPGEVELLTAARVDDLRQVVDQILQRYPPAYDAHGHAMPWDIEFGFIGDRTWLFQIRPFISNHMTQTLAAVAELDQHVIDNSFELLDLHSPPEAH